MKIQFKTIEISNFMSIGEASIDLCDRGYTLVCGENNNPQDYARSNGSGKSSILEAIVWCLTGDTMRGNKAIVNSFTDEGAVVTLYFSIDGKEYKLVRSKDHSKFKTNLKIYVDGEDKSGKGIRDTEKLLAEYLPDLTASLIGSVIVLGQGLPTRFTNNSPSGRKEVLEKLCKSDFMVQDLKDRIVCRKTELTEQLRNIEDKSLQTITRLEMCESNLNSAKSTLESLNSPIDYEKIISDIKENIEITEMTLMSAVSELDKSVATKSQFEQLIEDNTQEVSGLITELSQQIQPHIDSYKEEEAELLSKLRALQIELNRLTSITDICPTCGQKLQGVERPDTSSVELEIKEISTKLDDVRSNLRNTEELFNDKRSKIVAESEEYQNVIRNKLKASTTQYNEALANERSTRSKMIELSQSLVKVEEQQRTHSLQVQSLNSTIEEYKGLISQYQNNILYYNKEKENIEVHLGIVNKFNTVVTRDFRGYLLKSVIESIDKTAKRYSRRIFETDLINFVLDGNNISISYNGKEYEALSGGERQKVDLIIQFSIREMLCRHLGFSTNIIALDEIFDNLDDIGCSKVIDLISTELNDISTMFIITHHGAELSIPCDNQIIVVKGTDGVSYLK